MNHLSEEYKVVELSVDKQNAISTITNYKGDQKYGFFSIYQEFFKGLG